MYKTFPVFFNGLLIKTCAIFETSNLGRCAENKSHKQYVVHVPAVEKNRQVQWHLHVLCSLHVQSPANAREDYNIKESGKKIALSKLFLV